MPRQVRHALHGEPPTICDTAHSAAAPAEHFYLQLRLPGEASCFHFGGQFDGKTHLIIHRTCEERSEQWWQFERETLSFKHSTDSSVCLNWNTEKSGFDIWKCYNTPKQQFQFSKFRLTYCLRHDQQQCLQAVENLAGEFLSPLPPTPRSCTCTQPRSVRARRQATAFS